MSKIYRAQTHIQLLMEELLAEPFELQQLVRNHIAKAKLTEDSSQDSDTKANNFHFFQSTKASLPGMIVWHS